MLALLAGCLAAGILLADAGWVRTEAALCAGATCLLVGPLVVRGARGRAGLAAVAMASAGAVALGGRVDAAAAWRPARSFDATVEGVVCAAASELGGAQMELCRASDVSGARPLPQRIRVVAGMDPAARGALALLGRGDRARMRLRLAAPRPLRNPGGAGEPGALERRGVGARARLVDPALSVRIASEDARGRLDPRAGVERVRARISRRLAEGGPGGALLRALGVGDRTGLAPAARDAFAALGVAHLLAVSGLHLALVAAVAFSALRLVLVRVGALAARVDVRTLALAGGLAAALAYALLAGWGVPVRRALAFLAAVAAGIAGSRRTQPGPLLAGAAILVLLLAPDALFAPGAQLSFAASAALLASLRGASAPPVGGLGGRTLHWIRSLLGATASAVAATAPVLAIHGMQSGPYALVANLVLVPWTAAVLLPASLLSAAFAALPPTALGSALTGVAGWLAAATLAWVERAAATVPVAPPAFPPAPWTLAGCFLLVVLALRQVRLRRRVALALGVIALLQLAPPAPVPPAPPRVVGLDVGAGDATLVQGRRAAVLVDAGLAVAGGFDAGRSAVVPALLRLGVRRLDLVVASHADADHAGGLVTVLERLSAGELWVPPGGRSDPHFEALLTAAHRAGVVVRERAAGDRPARFGDLRVQPLWPPRGRRSGPRNERSLVLELEVAGTRVLLPGDLGGPAERALLESGAGLRAEILKLGHHGSRTSSSAAFLAAVDPLVAIASAPCSARSALPSADVLARVRAGGSALWWTGRDGAVLVALGSPLAAWSWSPRPECPER